ncbi:MAG: CAP domain-containing protein [Minisyncoccota bacterium]
MEQEIFALINKERNGVKPIPYGTLVWDEKLAGVARARAEEALATGEYGHNLPSGSPDPALTKIGYQKPARENIALPQSAAEAVKSWMDSTGHRASMLWPEARSIGVGVAVSKAPVKMHDEVHGGAVYEGIHVAVYAIFYASGK